MKRLLLTVLVGALALGAAGGAGAHRDPCHQAHSCPSDHHSYVWQGLSCTSYANERTQSDTKTVTVGGRTYWCSTGAAGSNSGSNSGSSTPAPPAGPSKPLGKRTKTSGCKRSIYPDPACSPGAVDPRVSQATIRQTICVSGYTKTVRNVSSSTKAAVYAEYGILTHLPYSYEVDHIVSLELGGSNSIANLYPEAYAGALGAHRKDVLENFLHRQVCYGRLKLATAQSLIAHDWVAAYHHYHLG
jgi:hypothetical protein